MLANLIDFNVVCGVGWRTFSYRDFSVEDYQEYARDARIWMNDFAHISDIRRSSIC